MTLRPDGLIDFADLPPALRPEAEAFIGSFSTLVPEDAPLFAFRITNKGRISTSRKDKDWSTYYNDGVFA